MELDMSEDLFKLRELLDREEMERLSRRASLSRNAIRRQADPTAAMDHRQSFAIDADRIIHSLAYTRYIDKTQVFYLVKNDHITHRVLHVQFVSRIARTIGRHLGLNEDLIEAIALGHDLGHAPFGHDGESYLHHLCQSHGIGCFVHAVQSVQFLEHIEKKGRGLNLTLQVLDGILSHDGEVDLPTLKPDPGITFEDFDRRVEQKKKDPRFPITPMTTEGCVVRLADTISYIGRDVEDAIRMGLIDRGKLPREAVEVLGDTNGKIVYTLVSDLILTSRESDAVAFSPEKASALMVLKDFNRKNIYYNPVIKSEGGKIKRLFEILFNHLLEDLESGSNSIPLFQKHLADLPAEYLETHRPAEVVRDYVAGMTDDYFIRLAHQLILPQYRTGFNDGD